MSGERPLQKRSNFGKGVLYDLLIGTLHAVKLVANLDSVSRYCDIKGKRGQFVKIASSNKPEQGNQIVKRHVCTKTNHS